MLIVISTYSGVPKYESFLVSLFSLKRNMWKKLHCINQSKKYIFTFGWFKVNGCSFRDSNSLFLPLSVGSQLLTLKASTTTAADDIHRQRIHMKSHALFSLKDKSKKK